MVLGTRFGHLGVSVNLFLSPAQQWQPVLLVFDPPPDLATDPIGFIHGLRRAVYSKSNLLAVTSEESHLQFTLLPPSDVLLTEVH
jgi:hypothetical protein